MRIDDLDHVQVAMPPGEEERARDFYGGVLGLREIAKPPNLAARGGVWFAVGARQLHLGVEPGSGRRARPIRRCGSTGWSS
jgi:catechol 2,3-dioxygenase-like lactoylglutathione lyase family enzyme